MDQDGVADIPISGTTPDEILVDQVTASLAVVSTYSGTPVSSRDIWTGTARKMFSGGFSAVPMGHYTLTLQFKRSGSVLATATKKVSVGHVVLFAGQSLLCAQGETPTTATRDDVAMYDVGTSTWSHCDDPPVFVENGKPGGLGSLYPHFGDTLAASLSGCPIGVVPLAYGGTWVADWLPGTDHYINKLKRGIQAFAANAFLCMIWQQGENDNSGTSQAQYEARLTAIIDQSRIDAGWAIPWGISISTYNNGSVVAVIQAAQTTMQSYTGCFAAANTDTLTAAGGYRPDSTHLNSAGVVIQAERQAAAIVAWL